MLLDQMILPPALKRTLKGMLSSGRFPHALLLEGETGTGKRTLARFLAAALCCRQKDGCGECTGCRKVLSGSHPDVTECVHTEKTGAISIDCVRDIIAGAYLRPNESDVKVYLILEAQQMTVQAQNALLKILEEPPIHVVFLLTCPNRSALLETVRSRVVVLTLFPPSVQQCVEFLRQKNPQWELDDVIKASTYTNGNIGRTIELIDDAQAEREFARFEQLVQMALHGPAYSLAKELAGFERQKDAFVRFLNYFDTALHRGLRTGLEKTGVSGSGTSVLQAAKIADIIEKTRGLLEQNVNFNLILTNLCIQLVRVQSRG